jgi:hypothetical protein
MGLRCNPYSPSAWWNINGRFRGVRKFAHKFIFQLLTNIFLDRPLYLGQTNTFLKIILNVNLIMKK